METKPVGRPFRLVKSYEARQLKKRPVTVKIADKITQMAGSVGFFLLNIIFFASWIFINSFPIAGFDPIDPFPFVMLTTIVSLEAIVLSIFVLMSQTRQSMITTLRDEIQLQVDLVAEKEVTKILYILSKIAEKQKIKLDPEVEEMLKETDLSYIERQLEKQLNQNAQPLTPADLAKAITEPLEQASRRITAEK